MFTKLHAAHLCVCSNGEPCAAGGPDRAAADSASVPAPPGVSPNPAWPCALASQKPQPHSSRHAKYNPVDSAARSSDSQCGQARRRAMRGRAHCSTHHTRGRALSSSGRRPLPAISENRKQARTPAPLTTTGSGSGSGERRHGQRVPSRTPQRRHQQRDTGGSSSTAVAAKDSSRYDDRACPRNPMQRTRVSAVPLATGPTTTCWV